MAKRKMKESGIDWIGKIPATWEIVRVKDKYIFDTGFTPDTKHSEYYADDEGYEWATITDINHGVIDTPTKSLISRDYVRSNHCKQVPAGCLLYSFKLSVGQTALTDRPIFTNEALASFLPSKDVSIPFLNYSSSLIEFGANTNIYGAKILNQQLINAAYVVFPPLNEQRKIADFLDSKCLEIDALSKDIEKEIETLEEYKKSVITETVTRGLDPNVEMKDSGIKWIGTIPSHWDIMPIKYLKSEEKNAFVDGPFGSNLKSEHFVENGDVYVIESGLISTGKFVYKDFKTITQEHFETIKRSECKDGDIIIAKIGANYGMAGELPKLDKPSVVSGNSLKLTLNQNKMVNYLFVRQLEMAKKNGGFVSIVNETAQPALSLGTLNNFRLIVAPINEQKMIASYLYEKCSEIDGVVEDKKKQLETLELFKKSLIYEYVTGKKEVV